MTEAAHDRRLRSAWQGALAGGGDPASSPLYVFGPFLTLLAAAGTTRAGYGAAIWLAVLTMTVVSLLYRLVMQWVTDGSGGTGLSEEELGPWAAKTSAAITCIEYTLTFLVSIAALVTFVSDRAGLDGEWLGIDPRTWLAVATAVVSGALVNRGPRAVSYVFGPATAGVLALLWIMMIATVARRGLHLAPVRLDGFRGEALGTTIGGFVRILAVMTGIEVFANLVASYEGPAAVRSRLAFRSLCIVMGSTALTMVVIGPAIVALTNPNDAEVSVFTQAIDALLPRPLALAGTAVSVLVLLSAAAASALGIQNLFLGLAVRHYAPAAFGHRNRLGIATRSVWSEVFAAIACFALLGTREGTYLAVYAAGVFVLLSMTGWAATVRLVRHRGAGRTVRAATFLTVVAATLFTTLATIVIFVERFTDGVWIYGVLIPLLASGFGIVRRLRGDPTAAGERMGRLLARWHTGENPPLDVQSDYAMPGVAPIVEHLQDPSRHPLPIVPGVSLHPARGMIAGARWRVSVPLDGSALAEHAVGYAAAFGRVVPLEVLLLHVSGTADDPTALDYLALLAAGLGPHVESVSMHVETGEVAATILDHAERFEVTLVVMSAHGHRGIRAAIAGSVTREVVASGRITVLAVD